MSYETPHSPPSQTPPPPAPAPAPTDDVRPNAARRAAVVVAVAALTVVGVVLAAVTLIAAVVVGALIGFAVDVESEEITHAPSSVEEIPAAVVADEAHVVIFR